MIINSASNVIYNGETVQSMFYNGRQVWPVTKSSVSLTLKHATSPTSSYSVLDVTADDPYTKIKMYASVPSSVGEVTLSSVPMNSNLKITCGRLNPLYSMFYTDDDSAHFGTSVRVRADRDITISAELQGGSARKFIASGIVYPLDYVPSVTDAVRWRLPLIVTYMSGCVWSAARTGLVEYTDVAGNTHSSSVPCSWIYCPDGVTQRLLASNYRFGIKHSSQIEMTPTSNTGYTASVEPFLTIPEFASSQTSTTAIMGGDWSVPDGSAYPPILPSASSIDPYWESNVTSPTETRSACVYPRHTVWHQETSMRSFGLWRISGVWQ